MVIDTASEHQEITVLYLLEGGDVGGRHQMLLITTDPEKAKDTRSVGIVPDDNFACWEERYLVSPKTAHAVEELLKAARYDKLPSSHGDIGTDMYCWQLMVSRGGKAKSVRVFDSVGVLQRFTAGSARRARNSDNEEIRRATAVFDLVEQWHRLARAEGEHVP